jgi:predicted outer membrane lipoprotein
MKFVIIILGLAAAGVVGNAMWQEHQQQRVNALNLMEERVLSLELKQSAFDSRMRLAKLHDGTDISNDPEHYDLSLSDDEKAELSELRRRVAAMKADGTGNDLSH